MLDLGVQDTGPDGAGWALSAPRRQTSCRRPVMAWSLRGAPHVYRRAEVAAVAAAVRPWSESGRGQAHLRRRRAAQEGRASLCSMPSTGSRPTMRDIAAQPVVKGEMSSQLTARLDEPYVRWCNPCQAMHSYEQPFRLSALQAGLELEPDTSPPGAARIKGWRGPAAQGPRAPRRRPWRAPVPRPGHAQARGRVRRQPGRPRSKAHWPEDTVPVEVDGKALEILADDAAALADPPEATAVRLLGPFDLFLQGRDRELVVPDGSSRKDLWRVLGRPGGVLDGHEVVGLLASAGLRQEAQAPGRHVGWRPAAEGPR